MILKPLLYFKLKIILALVINKIIPFFNKYPVLGVKSLDFEDFKQIAFLMSNKEHLTPQGMSRIIEIVNGMNLDRPPLAGGPVS